jgi:DNA invertase Pin-like site-specific DNA recombinase
MKAALYARCSTAKQTADGQLLALRAYCQQRGWDVVAEFVDPALSGLKAKRPQLDALLDAATRKEFDIVLVFKFDRMARSVTHLHDVLASLHASGIAFSSISEAVDTSTPAGKMIFSILGSVAQFERDLIMERSRAGVNAARERLARGPYRRAKDGRLVTGLGRPRSAVIDMLRVFALRTEGVSVNKISKIIGVPESTLRTRLKQKENNGEIYGSQH